MDTQTEKQMQENIVTAMKEDLTLIFYNGAVKFINEAIIAIDKGDYTTGNEKSRNAQAIITELRSKLDTSYSVGQSIEQVYEYIYNLLVEGSAKKDMAMLNEARSLVRDFRDKWKETYVSA